jgi:hypothetical protein
MAGAPPLGMPPMPAPPSKSSAGPLIGILLAIAVVGGGGWYGYRYLQNRKTAALQALGQVQTQTAPQAQGAPAATPAVNAPAAVPAPPATPAQSAQALPSAPATQPAPAKQAAAYPSGAPAKQTKVAPAPAQPVRPATPAPVPTPQQPVVAAAPQPVRAPVTQVAPQPEPQPAKPAPAARYSGPASGALIWSGKMEKGDTITLDGSTASQGTLNGSLPGVPVMVDIQPNDMGIAEAPGPSNGWKRLVLRTQKKRNIVVTITWKTL